MSGLDDPQVIELLKTRFVCVALDVWYEQRRDDGAGAFYRTVVGQRRDLDPERSTQGFYVSTVGGGLLRYWNNRDPQRIRQHLEAALAKQPARSVAIVTDRDHAVDPRLARPVPDGAAVVDVFARILDASSDDGESCDVRWPAGDRWQTKLHGSIGRDHLWILPDEIDALAHGEVPDALLMRIARFHLVDNTRGEPPLWTRREVKRAAARLVPISADRPGCFRLDGHVELSTADLSRGDSVDLLGEVVVRDGRLVCFDVVGSGTCHGESTYTPGAPRGKFPLAFAMRIAADDAIARDVPPQGARDLADYLRAVK